VILAVVCVVYAVNSGPILTPFGYRPSECVHAVEEGEIVSFDDVDEMFRIRKPVITNGVEEMVVRLELPRCSVQMPKRPEDRGARADPDGWAAYSLWLTTTAMDYYTGYWTIPPTPVQEGLQTLFLFTGFQNAYASNSRADVSIIQPVLQWGSSDAGGSKYWSIASWYVSGSHASFSPLSSPLNSGDIIYGSMELNGKFWNITTSDQTLKKSTSLTAAVPETEIDAFVTLEVYGVSTCSDYPNGSDTFSSLTLEVNGGVVTPVWQSDTQPGCEESVTIVNAQTVTLNF